nr:MAG TPA: hypothetical protein [Bacteriophage sp.]
MAVFLLQRGILLQMKLMIMSAHYQNQNLKLILKEVH